MLANFGSAVVLSLAALGVYGCGAAAEEPVLARFFAAARLRDHTALARLSTVVFEPQVDGIVAQFAVTNVTSERPAAPVPDVVQLSIGDPQIPRDRRDAAGVTSKDVTIDAQLRLFDGRSVQKTLIVTLQRAILKGDRATLGRWIVTAIRVAN